MEINFNNAFSLSPTTSTDKKSTDKNIIQMNVIYFYYMAIFTGLTQVSEPVTVKLPHFLSLFGRSSGLDIVFV